jgi:CheY-like chemotaxis protein
MGTGPSVVLLVEYDADHAQLIKQGLKESCVLIEVHQVLDGGGALDYLLRRGRYADPGQSPRPHLVLLNPRLPDVTAQEVLTEVKSRNELRDIPIVILAASPVEKDMAQAYVNHANSYLVKPTDFDSYCRLMRDIASYWLVWNQRGKAH